MSALAETKTPTDLPSDLTVDAFFKWLERQERRFELVEGAPQMLPFVKRAHSRIVSNIDHFLQTRLDRSAFLVHQGDFAVRTGKRSIRFADVMVEPTDAPMDGRSTEEAILIVEVLSESTAPEDFGPKRGEYQGLDALKTYLIVDQEAARVWQWNRADDGQWPKHAEIIERGSIRVAALGCDLPLKDIYFGVFEAPSDTTTAGR